MDSSKLQIRDGWRARAACLVCAGARLHAVGHDAAVEEGGRPIPGVVRPRVHVYGEEMLAQAQPRAVPALRPPPQQSLLLRHAFKWINRCLLAVGCRRTANHAQGMKQSVL